MTPADLQQLLARGEDSRHQFKRDETNADSIAAELAAFANSGGGLLLLGVNDDGSVAGLDAAGVRRLNQLISNAASQNIRPPIYPATENIQTAQGLVIAVTVPDGLSKPYLDSQGRIWVKAGAVRAAAVTGAAKHRAGRWRRTQSCGPAVGKRPQRYRPAFMVKAVAFPGTVLHDMHYRDSEDIDGTLLEQYQRCLAFIKRNLHHVQGGQNFNSLGLLEVPEQVIIELLINALIHRDYFTSASIRIMVFADRIEIISPGHLPDSLSIEAIRHGMTNRRNPTLTEHAMHSLPYRGLGSGIPRALDEWPDIRFEDEVAGNQFKAIVPRPFTPQVTPQVAALLACLEGEMTRQAIQDALELSDRENFRKTYLAPALELGVIEMTQPDKPNSRSQRYRLTALGRQWLKAKAYPNSSSR